MRAGFGLVGLLVCVGIIALLIGKGGYFNAVTSTQVKDAKQEAVQFSGVEWRGSVALEPESKGGKIVAINVTSVTAGGAAETYFGLQEADAIVEIGPLSVKDQINSSADADAFVMDAYQRHQTLVIMRNGKRLTLPQAAPKTAAGKAPSGGSGSSDSLNQQLDSIQSKHGL